MNKLSAMVFVWVIWAGSLSSIACTLQRRKQLPPASNSTGKQLPSHEEDSMVKSGEIKELAAGNHSTIFESFVLIARDSKTYGALRAANTNLPEMSAEFFETNAVVAAFLGQRRTSGYGVEIMNGPEGRLHIVEHAPPKGAMVKMVLSAPFKVVAIPVDTDQSVVLALDETWKKSLRNYRITSGQLSVTGGFAGVNQRRKLEGTIGIMRAGEFATFIFDLKSQAGQETKQLSDAASGSIKTPAQVSLPRLNSSSLTGAVQSPFQATGEFLDEERELRLSLQTSDSSNVSDNFTATAQLTAVTTDPPSRKIE
jgi:PrcB C-terminal